MHESQITLLQQDPEHPDRGQGAIMAGTLNSQHKTSEADGTKEEVLPSLDERKSSADRLKDDHAEASGRVTQCAHTIRVICLHTRTCLPVLIPLRVTLHLLKMPQQTQTSVPETSHECTHITQEDRAVTSTG